MMRIILVFFLVVIQQAAFGVSRGDSNDIKMYPSSARTSDNVSFNHIYRRSSGEEGSINNSTVLKSGDCHRIEFTSSCQNCYVYIIKYDGHEQVKMLFPTDGYRNVPQNIGGNPVIAGKTYFVPGQNNGQMGYFCLDNNTGYETVHFIVSKNPRLQLVANYKDVLKNNVQSNTIVIATVLSEAKRGDKDDVEYVEKSTTGTTKVVECKRNAECVKSITFKHE